MPEAQLRTRLPLRALPGVACHGEQVDEPLGSPQLRLFSFTAQLQDLVERLSFPAIGAPVKLLGRLLAGVYRQIG